MDNLTESLAERIFASLIERALGTNVNFIYTLGGIFSAVTVLLMSFTALVPEQYKPYLAVAVTIIAGIGGILARDGKPPAPGSGAGPSKLAVWALVALTLAGTLPLAGCTGSQVAQDIVNWTPTLQSAVATVDTTAAILLPVDAPIFAAATVGFDAGSTIVVALAKSYLANPSAGVLAQLQAAIVTLQQQVNTAVLQAAHIVNPASQQHALAALNAVATVINTMLGLVQQIGGKAALALLAQHSTVHLADVAPYLDRSAAGAVLSTHYGLSSQAGLAVADSGLAQLEAAGF